MYSCHTKRLQVVTKGKTSWSGFKSAEKCRFDGRYDELHQSLGCETCTRQWDIVYLKQQGLIK